MSSANTSKKSKKQLKEQDSGEEGGEKIELTKEETQIAKFLRLQCPSKQATLVGMKVNFFTANKLVDCLMDSKWGPNKKSSATIFANRQSCVAFMQRMQSKQLFYRVVKVYKETSSINNSSGAVAANTDTGGGGTPSQNLRKRNKANKEAAETSTTTISTTSDQQQQLTPQSQSAKDSKDNNKRKFKLEMHEVQTFVDSVEPYVWIYDPTSTKTYIIGFLLILGSIGICLFPLWPSQVREGVYYLSLAGMSVLGFILGIAVFKYVLYATLWLCTLGKLHFWLFPNLTEDVGFLDSFVPLYKIDQSKTNTSTTASTKAKQSETITTTTETGSDNGKNGGTDAALLMTRSGSSASLTKSLLNQSSTNATTTNMKQSVFELSKSTVEVVHASSNSSSDSPVILTKSTRQPISNDDEDFELLDDDDDLVKGSAPRK